MKFLLLITLIFSATCHALETDNYIVWDKELVDSSAAIDEYVNNVIHKVLRSKPESCAEAVAEIGKELKSKLVHDMPIENHLMEVLSEKEQEIYPQGRDFVGISIYRDPFRFYIPKFGLAPNIQVNGYYFGTDKLSHFASTGFTYFEKYLKAIKQGRSPESAVQAAIDWGIQDEKSVHGYWSSGVFSYADMEANYQGFLFYRSLCQEDRIRKPHNRPWMMVNPFRIKDYVSGFWDESYLESYRIKPNWKKVEPALRDYCPASKSTVVKERFSYYHESSKPSLSLTYLNLSKEVPRDADQSLKALCRHF